MKWEYKPLNELGTISRGRSKHRPRDDAALFGGKYPFIQTADVKKANLNLTEYNETYNEKGLAQSKLWDKGTLCITIAANIADTAILGIPACFPDSIMGFTSYDGISDVRFIKYCFDILQHDCKNISQGTAQDNLSWKKLSTIQFPAPSIETQHKIADILSAYDDLIENNQKQIKLLEEAAQRLYKEWFVDLRFLGHESVKVIDGVPEGWKNVTIGDVIAHEIGGGWGEDMPTGKQDQEAFVIRGTDFYAITHGAYMNIPFRYHSLSNLKERTLMDNDILFEVSGGSKTEGVAKTVLIKQELLREWNKPIICASFCKLIRLIDNSFSQYLFDHLQYLRNIGKTEMYDKRSASSIVNYRWKDFLTQEKMLLPSRKVLLHYNESAETIYKKIINCSRNIKTAQEARDRLLPKLMSGELEV